jgi:hypothetical protein
MGNKAGARAGFFIFRTKAYNRRNFLLGMTA